MPDLNIKPNIDYLKTPQAILKIVQFVTLLIAFSCITDCCDGGKPYIKFSSSIFSTWSSVLKAAYPQQEVTESDLVSYSRNISFFLAVTIYGWLLVVFFFAFFFLKFHERFNQINWEVVVMVISIVWSVLLLLCCSMMGNISSTALSVKSKIAVLSAFNKATGGYVDTMATGVAFGFFALIAFTVDAALLFWKFWSKRKAGNNGSPDNQPVTKVTEAPGPSGSTTQDQAQHQVPPAQTREAPPKYETVTNLPGQTVTNTAGQTVTNTAGQTVQYSTPGAVPYAMGQTGPAGQGMVMYPSGQQQQYYQTPSGQPVQWKMS